MNEDINYQNNPLHGVSLKNLLTEIVDHYGFDILYAYLNLNCFKTNAAIDSSVKFLKKTDWAREKVESFYLYEYKRLPLPAAGQLELSPRDRIVPEGQVPGEPAELSLEDAERLREKRAKKSAAFQADKKYAGSKETGHTHKRDVSPKPKPKREASKETKESSPAGKSKTDPWANSRK